MDEDHDVVKEASPFHAGESALQARAGVQERVDRLGRVMIRDHLIEQHREFFALLPTLLIGALDADGQPWASMLAGPPGFVSAADEHHLHIAALPRDDDPLRSGVYRGAPVGLLGLQPHTRRRNRMNGEVVAVDGQGFTVAVRQSFGNCPKYIQARQPAWRDPAPRVAGRAGGPMLDVETRARILAADTFFVASRSSEARAAREGGHGLDVSHRGGKPGFIRIDDAGDHDVLVIPDFVGNFLFNTLGNLVEHPACGLLFIDYAEGGMLQLIGDGEIEWEGADVGRFAGAERLWRFHVRRSLWRPQVLPLRWSEAELAPQLHELGAWR